MEKNKMKIWKKILIIAIIFFILLAICVTRKFIILSKLTHESKEFSNKTNYIATVQSLQNGTVNIMKSYNKDGNYLSILKNYSKDFDTERGLTIYKKDNEQIAIIKSGNEKIALLDGNTVGGEVQVVNTLSVIDSTVAGEKATLLQRIILSMVSRITIDTYNGKRCYLLEIKDWKMWIDKETGLLLREINGGIVSERFYEFDIVKDEDIVKPDTSDCKIK